MYKTQDFPIAVLFDFDGVVVNSFKAHGDAWAKAFMEIFEKEIPPFPKKTHEGKSPFEIAKYFCKTQNKAEKAQQLFDLKGKYLHNSKNQLTELLPGVKELSKLLRSKRIPYGIASNSTKQFVANTIQQHDIDFNTYLGLEDYDFPKPHPEPYIKLAKKLGIEENEFKRVWVLEDSTTGIKAACSAGMQAIGIASHNPPITLIKAGALQTFKSVLEVYEALNSKPIKEI